MTQDETVPQNPARRVERSIGWVLVVVGALLLVTLPAPVEIILAEEVQGTTGAVAVLVGVLLVTRSRTGRSDS